MYNQPTFFVIFGSTGDLAQKKVMPALQKLFVEGLLPNQSHIIAFSRREWANKEYQAFITPSLSTNTDLEKDFIKNIEYIQGTFDTPSSFEKIKERVGDKPVFYYYAIQPEFYETVTTGLAQAGLNTPQARVLIEKPFGHDTETALSLEKKLEEHFKGDQFFRIDHYLGKEGVVTLSHAGMPVEKKKNLTALSVCMLETLDIQGRGEFFEQTGAFKDTGQNHILQMLAAALMNPREDGDVCEKRAHILASLDLSKTKVHIRGQYEGYTHEQDVSPDSQIETYFKITTESTLSDWKGIPITIEGGKALGRQFSGIKLSFSDTSEEVNLNTGSRDAYEIIIEKAIANDKAYFVSFDEVAASWKFADFIIENMKKIPLIYYKKGENINS